MGVTGKIKLIGRTTNLANTKGVTAGPKMGGEEEKHGLTSSRSYYQIWVDSWKKHCVGIDACVTSQYVKLIGLSIGRWSQPP